MTHSFKKGNKFKAKRTEYNGVMYHSKREADYAKNLDLELKLTSINKLEGMNPSRLKHYVVKVERQVPMKVVINDIKCFTYYCDFVVTYADGRVEYHDVKGAITGVYKIKKKVVEAYFGVRIKEI